MRHHSYPIVSRAVSVALLVSAGLAALLLLPRCSDDDGVIRSAGELTSALEGAGSGDVVTIGGTTLRGTFRVPAGVTVEGTDYTLVVAEGGAGFVLEGGSAESPTVLRNLTVRVDDEVGEPNTGIVANGGHVMLDEVAVEPELGIGIVAQEVTTLTIRDTLIAGTLTDEALASANAETVSPSVLGVAGLVVVGESGTAVDIETLVIRDLAGFGAVFSNTTGSWTRGQVYGVAGTGVLVEASQMTLAEVAVHDGRRSPFVGSLDLGYGVVISNGSELETTDLEVVRIAGIGVLQDRAVSAHDRIRLVANDGPGLWAQNSEVTEAGVDLRLTRALVQGNRGAGVQLLDVGAGEISDSVVCDTVGRPAVVGETGVQILCDGIQVANPPEQNGRVRMSNVTFFGNGRVGVLASGDAVSTRPLDDGTVTICGNTAIGSEWSCSVGEDSVQTCTRTSGPRVADGWTCSDGTDGAVCTTNEPALMDAEPELLTEADADRPDDETCAAEVARITEAAGIVGGLGLSWEVEGLVGPNQQPDAPDELVGPNQRPDDSQGLVGPNQLPTSPLGRASNEWACETSGAVRECRDNHSGESVRSDDRDNPSRNDGPGWRCTDGEAGRSCSFSANGLLLANGASDLLTSVDVSELVAARDLTASPETFQLHQVLPTLCAGTGPCAGVAGGAVLSGGALVDESGRVEGVVGANGFERE